MRDEIVDGVIKKGYLTKKGHKRRNWKKRWFILQRTIMRYFESREKLILKVRREGERERRREGGKREGRERGRKGERERERERGREWLIRKPLIADVSAV